MQRAFLKEHVGLVKQQDAVPSRTHLQNVVELRLDAARIKTKITGTHHVERHFHLFSNGFRRKCLSHTRGTTEQDNHSATLALDDVVKCCSMLLLRLSETKDELFLILGQDQAVKCILLPVNLFDTIDKEVEPDLCLQAVATQERRADQLLLVCQRRSLGSIVFVCEVAVQGHAVAIAGLDELVVEVGSIVAIWIFVTIIIISIVVGILVIIIAI